MTNKELLEELLAKYQIPCSCKAGQVMIDGDTDTWGNHEKCGGSGYVLPDDIKQALSKTRQATIEEVKEKLCSERHINKAIIHTPGEIDEILDSLLDKLKKEGG